MDQKTEKEKMVDITYRDIVRGAIKVAIRKVMDWAYEKGREHERDGKQDPWE